VLTLFSTQNHSNFNPSYNPYKSILIFLCVLIISNFSFLNLQAQCAGFCNLVENGDFEIQDPTHIDGNGNIIGGIYAGAMGWQEVCGTPDYFTINGNSTFILPTNETIPPTSCWSSPNQGFTAYLGGAISGFPIAEEWGGGNLLCNLDNNTGSNYYLFTCKAKVSNHNREVPGWLGYFNNPPVTYNKLGLFFTNNFPSYLINLNVAGLNPLNNFVVNSPDLNVPNNGEWNQISVAFQYTGAAIDLNKIVIGNEADAYTWNNPINQFNYLFIDDVELHQLNLDLKFINFPICANSSTNFTLNQYVNIPGGIFSGPGVYVSGTDYLFDASIAGPGSHTLLYTYTYNGCPITISQVIHVGLINVAKSGCMPALLQVTNTDGIYYNYNWLPNNGITLNTSLDEAILDPSATNIYTITGTDQIGCTVSTSINVIPENCGCGTETVNSTTILLPTNSNSNDLYTLASSNINLTVSIVGGLFKIDNQSSNQIDIYIQGQFEYLTPFEIRNCNIIMVPYEVGGFNQTEMKVNSNYIHLKNCNVSACHKMWKGISTTNLNTTLEIEGSTIKDMIEGVNVNGELPTLKIKGCVFANNIKSIAVYGLNANSNGFIKGNIFKTILDINNISTMLPPYSNQLGYHGIYLQDALHNFIIGDVANLTSNTFIQLQNGIYYNRSNLNPPFSTWQYGMESYNNIFNNITGGIIINEFNTENLLYEKHFGCGIYINNQLSNNEGGPTWIEPTWQIHNHNSFENVSKGIVANTSNMIAKENLMNNVQCGILNNRTEYCHYEINNNEINDAHLGIQFIGSSGGASEVLGNKIVLNPNFLVMTVPIYYYPLNGGGPIFNGYQDEALWPIGIDVKNFNTLTNSTFEIGKIEQNSNPYPWYDASDGFSNIIEVPGHGGFGIQMNYTGGAFNINRNLVKFTNTDITNCGANNPNLTIIGSCGSFTGISVSSAENSKFVQNKVKSDNAIYGTAFNNRPTRGIYLDNSTRLLLECNSTAKVHYGFEVRGNCFTDVNAVRGNRFSNHKLAMLFRSYNGNPGGFQDEIGTSSGTIQDNGNLFNDNYYAYSCPTCTTKVLRLTSNLDVNPDRKIFINPTNPYSTIPNNILPSESKSNFPANQSQYNVTLNSAFEINFCGEAPTSELLDEDSPIDPDLALDIATTSGLYYPLFDEVRDFMDKSTLFKDLDRDSVFRNSNTTLNTFYNTKQTENIGKIYGSDRKIAELLKNNLATVDSVTFITKLNEAKIATGNITIGTHNYENWEKFVNGIYLSILEYGVKSIDSTSKIQIGYIARQCPAAVGPCVYKARSIFATLVPGIQYYDDLACAAMLPSNKTGENPYKAEQDELAIIVPPMDSTNIHLAINEIKVYPNPIGKYDNLSISYNIPCNSKIDCIILDAVGKKVQTIELECGKRIVNTQLYQISSGIYTVIISSNDKKIFKQKLNVQ
jgi:hypothetical protein